MISWQNTNVDMSTPSIGKERIKILRQLAKFESDFREECRELFSDGRSLFGGKAEPSKVGKDSGGFGTLSAVTQESFGGEDACRSLPARPQENRPKEITN